MKISIVLQALTGTFETDMKRASRETEKAAKKMQQDLETAGKAIGLAFAAAATAVAALVKKSIDNADELSKLSQKVGISVESLSALAFQANLSGVEIEGMQTALVKFNKTIGESAGGSKKQAATFAAMGISLRDAQGNLKSTETLLGNVADKFSEYEDGAAKTTLAVNLFGRAGADMIPMLNGGSKAMAEAAQEAKDLGQVIGSETGKQAEQFNDNMTRAGMLATGFGNVLAAKLLPALVGVTDEFIRGEKESKGFEDAADGLATVLKTLAGAGIIIKNVLDGLGITIVAIGKSAWAAGVLMTDMMVAPAKASVAFAKNGIDGVKAVMGEIATHANEAKDTWADAWTAFKGGWSDAGTDIMAGLSALDTAMDKPIEKAAEVGKMLGKAPIIDMGDGVGNASAAIEKLINGIAAGQEKLADMADSFEQFDDPIDEVMAKFRDQMIDIGRVAEEQQAKIDALRDGGGEGNAEAAAAAQVAMQDSVTLATQRAIASRDQSIESIMRERDVTSLYVSDLADEARLIGLTASQQRIEAVVIRALTEAKKANAAAGKEIVKVDAERIRQQAKLNEALSLAASINVKSPLFEMIDQAKELGEALKKGIEEGMDPELMKPLQDAMTKLNAQIKVDSIGGFKALLGAVQTFTKEGSTGFKNIEKGMAALSIIQDIIALKAAVTAVLTQGEGEPYSAFARMAAMAAAVAPFIASIGMSLASLGGGGGPSSHSSEVRQTRQGTGSVLGDAEAKSESIANAVEITADATSALVGINRGMLRALQSLQAGLGAAGGQLARGAGDVEFGGLTNGSNLDIGGKDPLTRVLSNLLFGGSKKIIDQGIIIAGGALNEMLQHIVVGAYQTIETSSGLFGGGGIDDRIVDISGSLGRQFQLVMQSIADAVREGAIALGMVPADVEAALAAYRVEEIRISLEDLSAEEQQAELAAVFGEIFDGLAGSIVPFIEQFQQVGEGLGETLVRVATGVQVTQEAMRQLGLVIDETDPERFAQISEGLIGLSGGIEGFISGLNAFVDAFATDADRLQISTDALHSAFSQYGLVLPETEDGMWALMQSLDATTEAGREQISTLLRLASTAQEYYSLLEKAEKARLDYSIKAADIRAELGIGEFIGERLQIDSWAASMADTLNDLARAAGRAGASESDLVNIHRVAAQRLAQLIEKLKGQLRDLAVSLGYTSAADTIESLTSQIESMSSASSDAAGAIGSAIDSMREKMNLLLGDLSPFNDQKKLELALEGLRAGTVDASTVLEIGRRLYASTSNYTNLFNQVMGMAQFGQPDIGSAGGATEAQGRTLAELIAARDALLAAQRPEMADELARRLAELAYATGEDFAAIAEQQGFTLDQLGADLNLNSEQLTAYLDQLQSQFEKQDFEQVGQMFQFEIRSSTDRIVAAITGEPSQALEYSDQRMQQITDQQAADRAASDQRVVDAIDRQTSAIIAASSGDSEELAQILEMTRRDLRETMNGVVASGERGRFNPPVQIR